MPTRAYISLLALILTLCVLGIASAVAQQYTTMGRTNTATEASSSSSSRSTPRSTSRTSVQKCTIQDVKAIKKFDRKAKRNLKVLNEGRELESSPKNGKKLTKASEFFSSEEYFNMRPVYQRCGKTIPTLPTQTPFWVPDEVGGGCTTCTNR